MSLKILTNCVAGIDVFMHDPTSILDNSEKGIVAVFIKNNPAFYAISKERLTQLLDIESKFVQPISNTESNNELYKKLMRNYTTIPEGKFPMYSSWRPDEDFQRIAALWGISLTRPVTPEEITAFIAYWQVEKKAFHHIQWQQKLARSLQISRINNKKKFRYDINFISEPDNKIPPGFRG